MFDLLEWLGVLADCDGHTWNCGCPMCGGGNFYRKATTMKPNGISLNLSDGAINMQVNRPSKTEDAIWDAVEEAIAAGWTPENFRTEAASAWCQLLRDEAEHAAKVLNK